MSKNKQSSGDTSRMRCLYLKGISEQEWERADIIRQNKHVKSILKQSMTKQAGTVLYDSLNRIGV